MKTGDEDAVSPVVGVMLMLVVTIIIAAVVSAFAGGVGGDRSKTPQATLTANAHIERIQDTDKTDWAPTYPAGFSARNGLLRTHGRRFLLSVRY